LSAEFRGLLTLEGRRASAGQPQDSTLFEFASRWGADNESVLATERARRLQLASFRITCCGSSPAHRLSQITVAEIDRHKATKGRKGVLSLTSKQARILEVAVDHGLIERNPAKAKRRCVKAAKPSPPWLEGPSRLHANRGGWSRHDVGAGS
jgi:hypothetical protein